ncbi:hypothetical protein T484DRAFT_1625516, partial [Baffinella frigidus]
NPKHETRFPKPETRTPKHQTRNPKPETRNHQPSISPSASDRWGQDALALATAVGPPGCVVGTDGCVPDTAAWVSGTLGCVSWYKSAAQLGTRKAVTSDSWLRRPRDRSRGRSRACRRGCSTN